jgi:hypothetical protein
VPSARLHPNSPHPTPTPTPREVISSKEKSKYKFPPAALPCEFGAFFQG